MSFIAKLFMPKMPSMPILKLPEVADVPNYDDEERKLQAAKDLKEAARNRKGRSSTILTTSSGLNEISDEEINKKSLLGDY
mgnify:CR=1 FL=1|tara:strand:+ start:192 stop:434 length:243 start_codon:yes stop_codon:yes gene_type:complete